jgi:putative methionine-R-sulfoxide reductase with GAF domain
VCVFFMLDEESDELVAAYVAGEHIGLIKGLRVPRGQRLAGWVAANRLTIRNSDPVLDFGESARAMTPRPRSSLSTPLLAANKVIGVLSLYSTNKDAYSEDHERIIEVVARQVSPVIVEAHAAERTRNESQRDESTGLPNLRRLLDVVSAHHGATDAEHPYCLVVARITSNNLAESSASGPVVNAVRRALRPADVLFGAGQNELVALLFNTELQAASVVAARVSATLDTLRHEGAVGSFRVGVACAPVDVMDGEELLKLARDRAAHSIPPRNEAIH